MRLLRVEDVFRQDLPHPALQIHVIRRGLVDVESAQLLASMRDRLGPEHSPPGHVAELSGAAFRVPLQALHRLEDPLCERRRPLQSVFVSATGSSTREAVVSQQSSVRLSFPVSSMQK